MSAAKPFADTQAKEAAPSGFCGQRDLRHLPRRGGKKFADNPHTKMAADARQQRGTCENCHGAGQGAR
jgi:hypothetical protein